MIQKWPNVRLPSKKSFDAFRFFAERSLALKNSDLAIENCIEGLFSFKCPYSWSKLQRVEKNVRFCSVCEKNVHMSHSQEEFERFVEEGKCVALSSKWMQRGENFVVMGEGTTERDTTVIMQLLKENVELWTKNDGELL